MKKSAFLFFLLGLAPSLAHAQGSAPEMFGVNEVIIDHVHFDDPETSARCGLTREDIAAELSKALSGSGVPAVAAVDAKPTATGTARIDLVPEISSHVDENLTCTSWVGLSAESRSKVVVMPVNTLRSETIIYWRQHNVVSSGESTHARLADDLFDKMAKMFVQQFHADQPSYEMPK